MTLTRPAIDTDDTPPPRPATILDDVLRERLQHRIARLGRAGLRYAAADLGLSTKAIEALVSGETQPPRVVAHAAKILRGDP